MTSSSFIWYVGAVAMKDSLPLRRVAVCRLARRDVLTNSLIVEKILSTFLIIEKILSTSCVNLVAP